MNLAAKVARRRDTNFGTHLLPWTLNSGITVTPFLTFKCIPAKAIGLPPVDSGAKRNRFKRSGFERLCQAL